MSLIIPINVYIFLSKYVYIQKNLKHWASAFIERCELIVDLHLLFYATGNLTNSTLKIIGKNFDFTCYYPIMQLHNDGLFFRSGI